MEGKQSHLRAQVCCCSSEAANSIPNPQGTHCSGAFHDGWCRGDAFPKRFRSHSQEMVLKSKIKRPGDYRGRAGWCVLLRLLSGLPRETWGTLRGAQFLLLRKLLGALEAGSCHAVVRLIQERLRSKPRVSWDSAS